MAGRRSADAPIRRSTRSGRSPPGISEGACERTAAPARPRPARAGCASAAAAEANARPSFLDRFEVLGGESAEQAGTPSRRLDPHASSVLGIAPPADEPRRLTSDRRARRRSGGSTCSLSASSAIVGARPGALADEEQELVLGRRDSGHPRELIGRAEKAAEGVAPLGERRVVRVLEPRRNGTHAFRRVYRPGGEPRPSPCAHSPGRDPTLRSNRAHRPRRRRAASDRIRCIASVSPLEKRSSLHGSARRW